MTAEQRIKNLSVPTGPIDVVLDTDTYNEIDDQFALAYLLRSTEKLKSCTALISLKLLQSPDISIIFFIIYPLHTAFSVQ